MCRRFEVNNERISLAEFKAVFGHSIPIGAVLLISDGQFPSPVHCRKALNDWLDEDDRIFDAYSKI